ncbi:hypothetical protein J6590_049885 [Homalodisca vitripennis]|nr:hypothetical protein J6590_049885 [Homalodisca vitripennis]
MWELSCNWKSQSGVSDASEASDTAVGFPRLRRTVDNTRLETTRSQLASERYTVRCEHSQSVICTVLCRPQLVASGPYVH